MNCPSCREANRDDAEACFTCGRSLHALTLGTVLAERYEILLPLGQGGMGTVYKARDRVLEEEVAIKVLRPDVARDPLLARRFRSEIKLARRVTHRNVCRIHEYGEDGPLRYISMEFIDGVDLRTILQSTSLDGTEAFGVALQVALGLHAVHDIGIIHRDLKSSNVMIDAKGVARLLDFGIAKEAGSDTTGFTVAGKLFGTPEYMSPEHARGSDVDFRSDIYSLGCLIYEIFTRRVPFHGENAAATIVKHLQEPPAFGSLIPDSLAPVLRKALSKSPAERYTNVGQLIDALDQARRTYAATQRPAPVVADQSLTRPIHDSERPPASWGSTYGSVWRRTGDGRMVPAPQPFALGAAAASSLTRLIRAAPTVYRRWRWAMPVLLLLAVVAGRQVLSRPLERTALNSGAPAPQSSPLASVPPTDAVFAQPSAPGRGETATPVPPPLSAPAKAGNASRAITPASLANVGPGAAIQARPSAAPSGPASVPSPKPDSASSPKPTAASSAKTASPQPSTPAWTLVAAPRSAPSATGTAPVAGPSGDRTAVASAAASTEAVKPGAVGTLKLVITPESSVVVDDGAIGPITTRELPLAAGPHAVRVLHPDYEPLQRKVTIREGAVTTLVLDLAEKGIRKGP
jgi:serine/threonine protein kinase